MESDNIREEKNDKVTRIIGLYTRMILGEKIDKNLAAEEFGVHERSIRRDFQDIDLALGDNIEHGLGGNSVIHDKNIYSLERTYNINLTNAEILAICKILIDSRAFTKSEMQSIIKRLINGCGPEENRNIVREIVSNELYHYVEPQHKTKYLDIMWEIAKACKAHRYIEIQYQGLRSSTVKTRKLKPLAIMFSGFYFYLTAFIDDEKVRENFDVLGDSFPTIYRVDRIKSLTVLGEGFKIPYENRFEEGEFRKRIQFMFGGKLRRITFEYTGYSIESVLDRLPTAKVVSEKDGKYVIKAEVFGDGIDMWLRSQGDDVRLLKG